MLIIRVYTLLGRVAVEVSCVHGSDPLASHLVWRSIAEHGEGLLGLLDAARVELDRAYSLCERGEVTDTDDCGL